MQITLLNTYPPKLIATILKGLREQLKENDQSNVVQEIARSVPEMLIGKGQILTEGKRILDDVNEGYLQEDLVLTARREEIAQVHAEGVYAIAPMQECKDAGKKPLGPIWVDTDKSVSPRLCAREYKMKRQGQIQRALFASQLFSAMPRLRKGKLLKLRHYDIIIAHVQRTGQRLIYVHLRAEDRQKYGEDKAGKLIKSLHRTSDTCHMWQIDCVNQICGELG